MATAAEKRAAEAAMEGKKVYFAVREAQKAIAISPMKKEGRNNFSKYDYFTPEQVHNLVFDACVTNNLFLHFSMYRSEENIDSIRGVLTIFSLEDFSQIQYEMPIAIPELKATNAMQKIGGSLTYTERYLTMTAFGITENSLDPDDKDNSKKAPVKEKTPVVQEPATQNTKKRKKISQSDKENWDKLVTWFAKNKDKNPLETVTKNYEMSDSDLQALVKSAMTPA